MRIHCKNRSVIGASKLLLSCASEFLRSLFTSKCECYDVQSMTFDIVCPSLESEAVNKVIDLIAGQEIVISESNKVLYRQICLVIELLKIQIDLPNSADHSFLSDDPLEITIDDDVDTNADAAAVADENVDEEAIGSTPGFQLSSFDCVFCHQVFTNTPALDSHIKIHFVATNAPQTPRPRPSRTPRTPEEHSAASEPQPTVDVKEETESMPPTDNHKCDSCERVFSLKFSLEQVSPVLNQQFNQ